MRMILGVVAMVFFASATCGLAAADTITITPTIPGSDLSIPSTVGTFDYVLPEGSTITLAGLGSPMFATPPITDLFAIQFDIDGQGVLSLPSSSLTSGEQFFLGSTLDSGIFSQLTDGSAQLSVVCSLGPCPTTFTRVSGDWMLTVQATTPSVPMPPTLALVGFGLIVLSSRFWWRKRQNQRVSAPAGRLER